jgi:hypothetical protein
MLPATKDPTRRFRIVAALIVLTAFLVREWFVLASSVEMPIRGDIVQYVAYAWNLIQHHTFSMASIGSADVPPDSFRGPGYPLFLALTMVLGGTEGGWYPLAIQAQVLLGTATVGLTMLLARTWLAHGWSLLCGVLIALWPHHVAATGALLTEVVFGFVLVFGLWLVARFAARGVLIGSLAGGLVFGYAYLVNQLILFFPVVAAVLLYRAGQRRSAVALVALPLLIAGAWAVRGAQLPPAPPSQDRFAMNLVQGSWPVYHSAYSSRYAHEVPRRILREIVAEQTLMSEDPRAGLRSIGERMHHDPGYYARWYLLEKPYLLWDWNIRIGAGGIYFHEVANSPFESSALLAAIKGGLRLANPLVFGLACLGAIVLLIHARRLSRPQDYASLLVALFVLYVWTVHWVLQSEPRYSIPYRPEQILVATSGLSFLSRVIANKYSGMRTPRPMTGSL